MKVLEGSKGYLFLTNDTNRSIDQYTGEYLISEEEQLKWAAYLETVAKIRKERRMQILFLVAPAKEYIYPENYPFSPGANSPMAQLQERFDIAGERIVYPDEVLRQSREMSYVKGDTHWSDYGGMLATQAVLNELGMPFDFEESSPKYCMRSATGDLGSHMEPPRRHDGFFAEFNDAGMSVAFDNGIANHGRIWLYEREQASGGIAVVFGDSFAKNVVPWLSLSFKRLVYVHSAAAIDPKVLALEQPDVLILQTNSRFVVTAPAVDLDTKTVIAKKVNVLPSMEKERLAEMLTAQPDAPYKEWMQHILDRA